MTRATLWFLNSLVNPSKQNLGEEQNLKEESSFKPKIMGCQGFRFGKEKKTVDEDISFYDSCPRDW